MRHRCLTIPLLLMAALTSPTMADEANKKLPDLAELEAQNAVIGEVTIVRSDVFDLSTPDENKWLYRWANRLHVITREKTVSEQLLFRPGDIYKKRELEESERILRRNKYLYDAHIVPSHYENGIVDLTVNTRDVWSISPELSISRSGGENRTRYGIDEHNLFGRGQRLRFIQDNDIDRSESTIEYADRYIGSHHISGLLRYSDNSDGDAYLLSVERPFYALDTRWSAGGSILGDDRRTPMYAFAEEAAEYRHQRDAFHLYSGRSKGLRNGWVQRWTTGIALDDNRFSEVNNPTLPAVVPGDRKLVYPFLGFELVEDRYVKGTNRDQIDRTEDFQTGLRLNASLGWADTSFGSDRDALIYSATSSRGFGSFDHKMLLLSAAASGRLEGGNSANAQFEMTARFYHAQSEKRLFFTSISGTVGHDLDLDNPVEIGGNSGLRGYPLRYQVGESRLLATIEQRYYTDWYPFRFARVGGAVFADVGQVWGTNPLGPDNRGWLSDVGFGLRLALTRVSDRIIHLDVAFPLNGDPAIDSVQFLLESRRSF
jgi:hemolysin activation/secretion protein